MKRIRFLTAMAFTACLLAMATARAATVQVVNNVTGNETWYSTNEYVLNAKIYVLSNAVLNIEAGTVIKGKPGGTNDATALFICQYGKIFANGTRTRPIIMTAEADDVLDPEDLSLYQRGLWGGLVVFGNATLNQAADATGNTATPKYEVYEGLSDINVNGQFVHRFGGTNDDDSSGVIRYVSIRHGGVKLLPNKEINGLSLGGVGRGTTVEYVEAYAIADDGFEFFGGTVNTKHLVSAFCDDDSFDADMGYRGKNQFWLAIQEPGAKDNGAEFNGEINGATTGNQTPIANYEIYNCTWIGAGTNTAANRGLQLRDYAAPKIYNSIITEFGGSGIRVDNTAGLEMTNGLLDLRDNLFWAFYTNNVAAPVAETPQAQVLFDDLSRSNLVLNPQLTSISRTNIGKLDPRPISGSPALSSQRTAPDDGFYTPVSYKGAFETNNLWITSWTALDAYGFLPQRGAHIVQVTDSITNAVTWYRTNEYVLNGKIYVLSNAVLNIEAGTVIKGKPGGTNDATALFICQYGKIFANGTAENPIIMTAEADDVLDPEDLSLYQRGLWGGLVVFGNATLNQAADATGNTATPKYEVYEGLSDINVNGQFVHRFGGTNDDDSSGVIRYVSIRHGGVKLLPNKEINGLSLGGVGRGTTVEYVEAYAIADDGFEFFGGTVNTKHLVSAFCDDDSFDADMGYRGKNQFWLAIQEPGAKDNGAEFNGEINGATTGNQTPIANYEIYNCTWIGAGTNTAANRGLQLRDYAAPKIYNSIITEFGGSGIRVDNTAGLEMTNGLLDLRDNLFWAFYTNNVVAPVAETPQAQVLFDDLSRSNLVLNPQLTSISRSNGLPYHLDPRPLPGSPALNSGRTAPNNGVYTPVAYKGAFKDVNWATDWTALGEYGIIATAGAGEPHLIAATPVITPFNLATGPGGSGMLITLPSQTGASYQLQSRTSLTSGNWINVGGPIAGTDSPIQFNVPTSGDGEYFQVVTQ